MYNKILIVCFSCFLLLANKSVYSNQFSFQETKVNVMNKKQALIIAQEQLKISDANKHFSSSSYKFINNKETRKYPYLFFISFEQNNPSSFFNIKFLVVINKKDNAIVYSGEWIPGKQTNFDWIYSQPDQKEDKLKKLKEKINELENKSK